jgi:hypothetical protein
MERTIDLLLAYLLMHPQRADDNVFQYVKQIRDHHGETMSALQQFALEQQLQASAENLSLNELAGRAPETMRREQK